MGASENIGIVLRALNLKATHGTLSAVTLQHTWAAWPGPPKYVAYWVYKRVMSGDTSSCIHHIHIFTYVYI